MQQAVNDAMRGPNTDPCVYMRKAAKRTSRRIRHEEAEREAERHLRALSSAKELAAAGRSTGDIGEKRKALEEARDKLLKSKATLNRTLTDSLSPEDAAMVMAMLEKRMGQGGCKSAY